jgi:hypothetical protein
MIFFGFPTPQMKHDVDSANFAKTYIEAQVFEPQLKFTANILTHFSRC